MRLQLVVDREGSIQRVEDDRGRLVEGVHKVTVQAAADQRRRGDVVTLEFVPGGLDRRVRVKVDV